MRVRVLGRLMLATAVLVSVGGMAQSAGASGGGFKCTGTGGGAGVKASPGLLLSTGKPQTITWGTHMGCTGGFVTGGSLTGSMQTPQAVRCSGIIGLTDRGTAKLVWDAADQNGKTTLKLNMKITSSSGQTTTGTLSGVVTTSGSNFASGKAVAGTFTLHKGLSSINAANPGNCSGTVPLTDFPIDAISLHT